MTCDHDVCKDMELHHFFTLENKLLHLKEDVSRLRDNMKEWGFDSRSPLKSDSFIMPKLVQFEADLIYVLEELNDLDKKRRASE